MVGLPFQTFTRWRLSNFVWRVVQKHDCCDTRKMIFVPFLGWGCTERHRVQYRTVPCSGRCLLDEKTRRESFTWCDRVRQLFLSNVFLRTSPVLKVIILTHEFARAGEHLLCRFYLQTCWTLLISRMIIHSHPFSSVNDGNFCVFFTRFLGFWNRVLQPL